MKSETSSRGGGTQGGGLFGGFPVQTSKETTGKRKKTNDLFSRTRREIVFTWMLCGATSEKEGGGSKTI